MFDNREAQTGAFFRPAGLHIDPIESLGQPWNMFLGDAGTEVPYAHLCTAGLRPETDTSTRLPVWPYLQAFSIRLEKT
jgi:hypothetical protein